ncbi:unnamed protein product, partial [Rotaria magnacalcarata]
LIEKEVGKSVENRFVGGEQGQDAGEGIMSKLENFAQLGDGNTDHRSAIGEVGIIGKIEEMMDMGNTNGQPTHHHLPF